MRRRGARGRRAGLAPAPVKWALVLLLFAWAGEGGAAAVEPALLAEAACDPAPGPGKIHCTVRQRPKGGKWTWGDVIVVSAPPFAPPLRTRVAAGDASRSDADGADFALALAATADGSGELRVLARAIVCGSSGCRPVRAEASAKVVVGAQPGTPL
jgi:hypothetical protein